MPRKPYAEQIFEEIRDAIADGRLKPGQKLPSATELAAQYGCSLMPVKQAVKHLEILGLVEGHRGKGVYVAGGGEPASN